MGVLSKVIDNNSDKIDYAFNMLEHFNATDADPFAGDNDITVTYGAAV